ncbi:hypothetical protein ACHAWF_001321 [Thalassiosira exigua]
MQDASRRMDALLKHATEILEGDSSGGGEGRASLYCPSCLDRISVAIETCSERLEEESVVYDKAAAAEEERAAVLSQVLSVSTDPGGLDFDEMDGNDEKDAAILRALDSFQYELDTLTNACDEQENELRTLQNFMQEQVVRSNAISELFSRN